MLRFLCRAIVLLLVLAGAAFYWWGGWDGAAALRERAEDTALGDLIERESLREAGAQIAGAVSSGAGKADMALTDARLTAKITSKMALDDTISVRRLDVDTSGSVVTVRGVVDTTAQRERALQLARETDGVTSVVDRMAVVPSR
jgi:osmotically-inducible protein OsmY